MAYNQPYGMPYGYQQNYPYGNIQMQQPYVAPQPQVQQPAQQPQQNQSQQPMSNFYAVVNGIDGVKNYQVLPNQTVLLMDNSRPVIYSKSANGLGQVSVEYFKLVPMTEEEAKGNSQPKEEMKYASISDFKALEQRFNNLVDKLYNKPQNNAKNVNNEKNKGGDQ